ncbi:MAG TPA: sugar-transfer associated ATP-grasp domain-containing protein [Flavobacterium sp.]|nr:sugar-transfer associated ATP-grasp domain-containing protein [Flavobacterium sp.]
MKTVNGVAQNVLHSIQDYFYDKYSRERANIAYLKIIQQTGGKEISNPLKKTIREYSIEVLGSKAFTPWLYVYTAYQGAFVEGWIPENYFGRIILPAVNKNYRNIGNAKTLSRKILHTDKFPDLMYFLNGSWFDTKGDEIFNENVADKIFENHEEVFIKLDNSSQGRGIFIINRQNFNLQEFSNLGDFVVQAPIKQADWFNEIIKGSVATLRLTTVKASGNSAQKRAAYLRVGQLGGSFIASAKALKIPVIDDNGKLGEFATGPDWRRYSIHPDTGFKFDGQIIPYFKEAVRVCEKLHNNIPYFTIIGWDVAVTDSGTIKIMEWNTNHPDIKFSEASIGPCFKELGWESLWKNILT